MAITIFTFGNMLISLMLILLMVYDGSLQLKTNYESNNFIRLITGLGFGYSVFSVIVHSIAMFITIIN